MIELTAPVHFTYPTPADGAIIPQDYAYINTTVLSPFNTTAFIDWNRSLAGWWRFNNESSENSSFFRDWSSWGNNGTCSGTTYPDSTSGKFGNALRFDGSNDYVSVLDSVALDITGEVTIETWIKPGAIGTNYTVGKGTTNLIKNYNYVLWIGNTYAMGAGFGNGTDYRMKTSSQSPLTKEQWYHLTAVIVSNTDIKLYLNGNELSGSYSGNATTKSINNNSLYIGFGNVASNIFNGTIDEVRIYNRTLSPEEINASYNAGINRLYHNFTSLMSGNYTYVAYVQNSLGNVNQTEMRTLARNGTG